MRFIRPVFSSFGRMRQNDKFSRPFQKRMAWITFTKREGVQQQISFYESKCLRKSVLKATIQCTHALTVFIFPLINVLDGHLLCNIQMGLIEFPLDKYSGFSLLFSKWSIFPTKLWVAIFLTLSDRNIKAFYSVVNNYVYTRVHLGRNWNDL